MNNLWFISDSHFMHENILKFTTNESEPLRSFIDVNEMDETIIENWNYLVKPQDKIYHLGDLAWGTESNCEKIMNRLNGHKRFIFGNHDKFKASFYSKYFEKTGSEFRPERDIIFTHRPILLGTDEFEKIKWNVHGHTHSNDIQDNRYLNISIEKTNYSPIHYDEIRKILNDRNE